jgi:hypothetical protein
MTQCQANIKSYARARDVISLDSLDPKQSQPISIMLPSDGHHPFDWTLTHYKTCPRWKSLANNSTKFGSTQAVRGYRSTVLHAHKITIYRGRCDSDLHHGLKNRDPKGEEAMRKQTTAGASAPNALADEVHGDPRAQLRPQHTYTRWQGRERSTAGQD